MAHLEQSYQSYPFTFGQHGAITERLNNIDEDEDLVPTPNPFIMSWK